MTKVDQIKKALRAKADPVKKGVLERFFKTGPGEYGEGDLFLGVVVPEQRQIAKAHLDMTLADAAELLASPYHEERFTALLVLNYQYLKKDEQARRAIYDFYLAHTGRINNWDLVDVTCRDIVGTHLLNRDRSILYKLAKSKNLWERRIAIVATYYFIKRGQADDTLLLAEQLLSDKHDLMHKAVGWMLREVGKNCSQSLLTAFLDKHGSRMPRTMLRYAIERLPAKEKSYYLSKTRKKSQ